MTSRARSLLLALVVGLVSALGLAPASSSPATGWYLAVGDSLAAGTQLGDADLAGGYAGPVASALDEDTKTRLRNLGCPGETSTTLVAGGRCAYDEGTQLEQAVVFLRAHGDRTRLVTLTVGANDVTSCLAQADVTGCVQQRLAVLAQNLDRTLGELRAAAPDVEIVVTNYYNPYLAAWFTNRPLAALTSQLQVALNQVITQVTAPYDATVADVATAFRSFDTTLVNGVPVNVATVCQLTWMCSRGNIHANDVGYAVIAEAVLAAARVAA